MSVAQDERGQCKGFGFVCFASPDEATKAAEDLLVARIRTSIYTLLVPGRDRHAPEGGQGQAFVCHSPVDEQGSVMGLLARSHR